jgi:hypothetical protein
VKNILVYTKIGIKIMTLLHKIYIALLCILICGNAFARNGNQGCCSWHGGVGGCDTSVGRLVCSDGLYSPSCGCKKEVTINDKIKHLRCNMMKYSYMRLIKDKLTWNTRKDDNSHLDIIFHNNEVIVIGNNGSAKLSRIGHSNSYIEITGNIIIMYIFLSTKHMMMYLVYIHSRYFLNVV